MSKLTIKQKKFADEYIINGNATEAAIKAGYSENYAKAQSHKLLVNVGVQKYIEERIAEIDSEKIADQKEIMEYLSAVVRREKTENVVVTLRAKEEKYLPDEDGRMRKQIIETEKAEIVEIPSKLSDANKAAELLGKRYSMWTDKLEVTEPIQITIKRKEK